MNLRQARYKIKKLQKIADDILDCVGDPDWGFENGYGQISGGVHIEDFVKWHKALDRDIPEGTYARLVKEKSA